MNIIIRPLFFIGCCLLWNALSANEIRHTFEKARVLIYSNMDSALFEVEQLGAQISSYSKADQANFHHEAAQFYATIGNFEQEVFHWQKKIEFLPPATDTLNRTLIRLGTAYMNAGQFETALATFTATAAYFSTQVDPTRLARSYSALATLLGHQGKSEDAIVYFKVALKIYKELGNQKELSYTYSNLGILYSEMGELDKAMNVRKKAYTLAKMLESQTDLHLCEVDIGSSYNAMGQFDSALFYLHKAEVFFEQHFNAQSLNGIYNEIGRSYSELGDNQMAEVYYLKSIDLLKTGGFDFALPGTLGNYGHVLNRMSEFEKAVGICNEALPLAKKMGYLDVEAGICECLYTGYKGLNGPDSALYYFEKLQLLTDSVSNVELQKSVLKREMEISHEFEKETLMADANKEIGKVMSLRNFWIFGASILFIAAIILFFAFQQKKRAAKKINDEKKYLDNLLHNLVHEFRTPLTLIKGPIEELLKGDKENELLQLVDRSSDQMLNLVNQVLDFAKIKAGRMAVLNEMTDLSLFYEDALALFRPLADEKNIQLINRSSIKGISAKVDSDKLFKILSNLLTNALKYSNQNAVVTLQSELIGKELVLIVEDTGIGIAVEDQEHVFQKFYQVDATATRKGEGTGLGLAFVRELVQLMGGSIKLESEINKGTKITVIVPVEEVGEGTETKVNTTTASVPKGDKEPILTHNELVDEEKKQILIVEDNSDLRKFLSQILVDQGFVVHTAKDGLEGATKAEQLLPDLVICDVMMPKMDGIEVVQKLKSTFATDHIPIIILTAKASFDSMLDGLSAGADDYLSKPFKSQELLLRVANQIKRQENLHSKYRINGELIENQPTKDALIQKIETILMDDLSVQPSTEELADKCALSRSQLHRKIKFLTGLSTTALLTDIRLNLSLIDLKSTELSISEIAYKYGYSDPAHYSKLFKKQFGETPTEFRNAAR